VGIFFATDKGKETRHKINEEGKKLVDAVKGTLDEVKKKFAGACNASQENENVQV